MDKIVVIVTLMLIFSSAALSESKLMNSLEEKFVKQSDYKMIYQHENIPADITKWVYLAARTNNMANYGQAFNAHDLIKRDLPMVQHQFTSMSDNFGASLIKIGGFFQHQKLVLVDRSSKLACVLKINPDIKFIEGLKYMIENKREVEIRYYSSSPNICKMLEEKKLVNGSSRQSGH
jgi:hypothetical protein